MIHPMDMPPSETVLLNRILLTCNRLGLNAYHCWYSGHATGTGFPDLVIAGPGGHAFWELKTITGLLTPQQDDWRDTLLDAGAPYSVITPADWASGAVHRWLERLADWEEGEAEAA